MDKSPSYLKAMLVSPINQAVCGIAGMAAVVLSFPLGVVGVVVAALALGAIETVAALIVPDMERFRKAVDSQHQYEGLQDTLDILVQRLNQIDQNWYSEEKGAIYRDLSRKANELTALAKKKTTRLSHDDALRIQYSRADFLALCLSQKLIDKKKFDSSSRDNEKELRKIADKLAQTQDEKTVRLLRNAQKEYEGISARFKKSQDRKIAVDAALAALPDKIDELYHMIVAAPYSQAIDGKLESSLARLELESDLDLELNDELREWAPDLTLSRNALTKKHLTPAA